MSFAQQLRFAWRSLRRTPAFTISAILTLVIGIGASVAIFAVINGVLLRPLPYGEPDRLVGTWFSLPGVSIEKGNQTSGTYYTFRRFARSIVNMGLSQESAVNLAAPGGVGEPERVSSAFITGSLIPTLQVTPLLGRNFSETEDAPNGPIVAIISEQLWRTQFGSDPAIIGKLVDINGMSREVVGVMPASFRYPTAETRLWFPLQLDPNASFSGGFNYNGVARLAPGFSVEAAQRDFVTVLPRWAEIYPSMAPGVTTQMVIDQAKPNPILVPLREDQTSSIAKTLWMVAAAAGLVLLVACANVANLILVRADSRHRELAVREALGAGRARVLSHFAAESTLLAGISGALGLVVAWMAVRGLVVAHPADIPRLAELRIDATTVLFAFGIAVFVALLTSAIPALRVGRSALASALREGGRSGMVGKTQQRLRGAMVSVQIALALVVLAGSGLLLRTFQQLTAVRPGFNSENVATFWLSLPRARYANDSAIVRFWSDLTARTEALPGVRSATVVSRLPLLRYGMNNDPFYPEGDAEWTSKIPPLQIYARADGRYFETMGIPLIAGRTFERLGVQHDGEAIISQRTAELFFKDSTGQSALGKRFRELPGGPLQTVIGVVGTVRDTSVAGSPTGAVYYPVSMDRDTLYGSGQRAMALVVKTTVDPSMIRNPVLGVVQTLDATLPTFDVRPMPDVLRNSMAQLSFMIVMLGAAALVTLLLGAIGLYGVMAYVISLRTRELGVRVALGASPRSVAAMITGQGLTLTLAGVVGGLVLFTALARFLKVFLYGVAPGDPLTLVAASTLLIAIAALASWIPARRAARVDPAEVLRAE
jgi:predicted permease